MYRLLVRKMKDFDDGDVGSFAPVGHGRPGDDVEGQKRIRVFHFLSNVTLRLFVYLYYVLSVCLFVCFFLDCKPLRCCFLPCSPVKLLVGFCRCVRD